MYNIKKSIEWREKVFSSRDYFIDKYWHSGETNWTSFHQDSLRIATADIMDAFSMQEEDFEYLPFDTDEKVQIHFAFALELNGERIPFTVYSWKEYRQLNTLNVLNFHIGAHNPDKSKKCLEYLKKFIYEEINKK